MRAALPVLIVAVLLSAPTCTNEREVEPRPMPNPTGNGPDGGKLVRRDGEYWPASAPVEMNVPYRYHTGHCGLEFITDFDGSFWKPTGRKSGPRRPYGLHDEESGTLTLIAEDTAIYESSTGKQELTRTSGPYDPEGVCF